MKGKKLIAIMAVLGLCILSFVLLIVVTILIMNTNTQNSRIDQLQNQLNQAQDNSSTNTTQPEEVKESVWIVSSKSDMAETSRYSIDIVYPVLSNPDQDEIEADVNSYIKSLVNTYKNGITLIDSLDSASRPFISLDYEVKFLNSNLVSIVLSGSQYFGGAHPTSIYSTINYNLRNNNVLELTDIFNTSSDYLEEFSMQSKSELIALIGVDEDDSLLVSGTSEDEDNFSLIYFSGDEDLSIIGIIFNEYQVAPYAVGAQTVELDEDLFSGMYSSEFAALL